MEDCKTSIDKFNTISIDLYTKKVSTKLFYWLLGIGVTVLLAIGGIQISNQNILTQSLKTVSDTVIAVKVNQDNLKEDVDSIKNNMKPYRRTND
jgi:hypothetical protein